MDWNDEEIARVTIVARGRRDDYRLDPRPLDTSGGQGLVIGGDHKATGFPIALKKRRDADAESILRMRREIAIGRVLRHPNVMPVLDAGDRADWLVMPRASGNAEDYRDELTRNPDDLRRMVDEILSALAAAHETEILHRDIKPANLLRIGGSTSNRWVLADWGLGRRARGRTTLPVPTRVGTSYGTEGFAAPEMSSDAHSATEATDLYSVGQLLGWVLTGQNPKANVPLLPAAGPWRSIIRAATTIDQSERIQSVGELTALIQIHLEGPPTTPSAEGERLLRDLKSGDVSAAAALCSLAIENPDDADFFIDVLPQLQREHVSASVESDPAAVREIMVELKRHLNSDWGYRDFNWANQVIRLPLSVAEVAGERQDLQLFEEAVETLFAWDAEWDRWSVQSSVKAWLRRLRGEPARIAAGVLMTQPQAAAHFSELGTDNATDKRIQRAVTN